jgi:3-hydroxyacyl-[acyl-carrier-protein] dehydratase
MSEGGLAASVPEANPADIRTLDAAFIEAVLPHRPPALLVERALVFSGSKPELRGLKAITSAEPCFLGTGAPPPGSYPRCLVVESFCQSCGLLRAATSQSGEPRDPSKVPVVAKLANLRFFGDAVPGEQLEHRVRLTTRTPDGAVFSGETVVSGRVLMQVDRVVAATAAIARTAH